MIPSLLQISGLTRWHRLPAQRLFGPRPWLKAVDGISLTLNEGESLGIVGESGCGKSTLARLIMGLDTPTAGDILLTGDALHRAPPERQRALRQRMQMVFQDPFGSLDPRWPVWRIVTEPLHLTGGLPRQAARARAAELLTAVGLDGGLIDRYPHEFSGGQRQRIAIARALVTDPTLLVADEPVSALDLSVQAQVLNLLMDLRAERGLALLLISHNLSVVAHVTERLAVMYRGRFVERGATAAIFARPRHPYTQALLAAEPSLDPAQGLPPAPPEESAPLSPEGCAYAGRCPLADDRCRREAPVLRDLSEQQAIACHHA